MAKEIHYYTREQVEQHLTDALVVVNACEIDGDLREAAFVKAVELLSGKQLVLSPAETTGGLLAASLGQPR